MPHISQAVAIGIILGSCLLGSIAGWIFADRCENKRQLIPPAMTLFIYLNWPAACLAIVALAIATESEAAGFILLGLALFLHSCFQFLYSTGCGARYQRIKGELEAEARLQRHRRH